MTSHCHCIIPPSHPHPLSHIHPSHPQPLSHIHPSLPTTLTHSAASIPPTHPLSHIHRSYPPTLTQSHPTHPSQPYPSHLPTPLPSLSLGSELLRDGELGLACHTCLSLFYVIFIICLIHYVLYLYYVPIHIGGVAHNIKVLWFYIIFILVSYVSCGSEKARAGPRWLIPRGNGHNSGLNTVSSPPR